MRVTPRYDGPTVVSMDDPPGAHLAPFVAQHRRFEALLAGLSPEQWAAQSRCELWSVRDVIAHLVSTNDFWYLSVRKGLSNTPTRYLAEFDPAATPAFLVSTMSDIPSDEILERFVASNDKLVDLLSTLGDDDWASLCETPAGHVAIQILVQHGLWDSWIHERDVALPLGLPVAAEPDEIAASLRFAAAISPVLGLGLASATTGEGQDLPTPTVLAVEATGPTTAFTVEVSDRVLVRRSDDSSGHPTLRGDAVVLTEALSLRGPLPDGTPDAWRQSLGSLTDAFT